MKAIEEDILDKYKNYIRLEQGLSENSVSAYMRDAKILVSFLETKGLAFTEVRYLDLQGFVAHLFDLGISPNSVSRKISGIRSFFHFLLLDEYIEIDPSQLLEFPKKRHYLPNVLSLEEVEAMKREARKTSESLRNSAIIEMLYSCGLRVSELCHLQFADISFEDEYLRVLGKGNKMRLVPISPLAIRELEDYLAHARVEAADRGEDKYIFLSRRGRHISRNMVFKMIKEVSRAAGIMQEVSPHTLRHSFATSLLEGGASLQAIQLMLGHEDISTTEIYAHLDRSKLREEINRYHPRNMEEK